MYMSVYEVYFKFTEFSFSEYLLREMTKKPQERILQKKNRHCNIRFLFKLYKSQNIHQSFFGSVWKTSIRQ